MQHRRSERPQDVPVVVARSCAGARRGVLRRGGARVRLHRRRERLRKEHDAADHRRPRQRDRQRRGRHRRLRGQRAQEGRRHRVPGRDPPTVEERAAERHDRHRDPRHGPERVSRAGDGPHSPGSARWVRAPVPLRAVRGDAAAGRARARAGEPHSRAAWRAGGLVSSDALAPTRPLGPPRARAGRTFGTYRRVVLLLAVIAVFFFVWEMGVTLTGTLEIILPKPTSIYRALVSGFFDQPVTSRASYIFHMQQSLSQILSGYVVGSTLGLLLAMVSVRFSVVEFVLRPFVVALQSMPKIALAPVLIVWFGLGFNSKFVLVVLATFFPLFVNGVTGFTSVEEGPLRMMRSFGASPRQIFTKLTFPTALPFIFAGLEIAMVHAITSGIAAEFLGGQRGLGTMMLIMQQIVDVPGMFSVLVILAFIGWLLSVLLAFLRRRIVFWAPDERTRAQAGRP